MWSITILDALSLIAQRLVIKTPILELVDEIPSETQMGKVYTRLILSTLQPEEDYIDGMIRVYNDEICDTIDNYNSSAYYEPSYVITRAYNNGGF